MDPKTRTLSPRGTSLLGSCHEPPTPAPWAPHLHQDMNIYELIRGRRHYVAEDRLRSFMYQLLKAMDHMHRWGGARIAYWGGRAARVEGNGLGAGGTHVVAGGGQGRRGAGWGLGSKPGEPNPLGGKQMRRRWHARALWLL